MHSKSKLVNVKVRKDMAYILKVYCVIHDVKMAEYLTEILETELEEFSKKLQAWKDIT